MAWNTLSICVHRTTIPAVVLSGSGYVISDPISNPTAIYPPRKHLSKIVKLNIHVTAEVQKCFQSNTTIFSYASYWQQVSGTRPSSGCHYIKFKTGYM
jgi:hypothetical protein